MKYVLLTFQRSDQPFVDQLVSSLEHPDLTLISNHSIAESGEFTDALRRQLLNTDATIVLLSTYGGQNGWVANEVARYLRDPMYLVLPVLLQGYRDNPLFSVLGDRNGLRFENLGVAGIAVAIHRALGIDSAEDRDNSRLFAEGSDSKHFEFNEVPASTSVFNIANSMTEEKVEQAMMYDYDTWSRNYPMVISGMAGIGKTAVAVAIHRALIGANFNWVNLSKANLGGANLIRQDAKSHFLSVHFSNINQPLELNEVPASTSVFDIARAVIEQHDAWFLNHPAVIDHVTPDGRSVRLNLGNTLAQEKITEGDILRIGLESRAGCFTPETTILMANSTIKQICELVPGDEIAGTTQYFDQRYPIIVKEVVRLRAERYMIINNRLQVTPSHPVLVNYQWTNARELRLGDQLYRPDGSATQVQTLTLKELDCEVYNLVLDPPLGGFFAEEILVQNVTKRNTISALEALNNLQNAGLLTENEAQVVQRFLLHWGKISKSE